MSVIDPLTCGFMKVFCYNLFKQAKSIPHTPGNHKHNQIVMLKENYDSFRKPFLEKLKVLSSTVPLSIIIKKLLLICNLLGKNFRRKRDI